MYISGWPCIRNQCWLPKERREAVLRNVVAAVTSTLHPSAMVAVPMLRSILLPCAMSLPGAMLCPASLLLPRDCLLA